MSLNVPAWGHKTLDRAYTNVAEACKATPLSYTGQTDHLSSLLLSKEQYRLQLSIQQCDPLQQISNLNQY